jgi:FAD/FMN-containing dehydrogenase/Fe-S oxidoreductase
MSATALPDAVARRLAREIRGAVLLDPASRGRYATDASIYQILPLGVVVPQSEDDVATAIAIAAEAGVPVLPRGGGTSQCGQTVGAALVIDTSRHLDRIVEVDTEARTAWVEPGVVLDHLNAHLKASGLWYPVDVSTSAQATLGGMAGNNSCGARSIRHGNMVHNVLAIEAWLADGERCTFGPSIDVAAGPARYRALVERIHAIATRERDEIEARWPKVLRRVQGYNLDMVQPHAPHNLAHLLVGSEGTLAWFRRLKLALKPLPAHKVLGVAHFPSFYDAMAITQEIVKLDPEAVELVDRTMIGLARGHDEFRPVVEKFFLGQPDAILLVEFAGDDKAAQVAKLDRLVELLADHGIPDAVVKVTDARQQRDIWEVRKAGLNIMMSMKGDGKPVSFIEDCAVPLEHLAEYTRRIDEVFAKHGTRGTWYAHASVGTLHVRPVLDMKTDGAVKMRAIAEEACALVREYKGAFSGEHGDGLVRSEWIEPILGSRLTAALGEVKAVLDPQGLFNPGKIVRPTRMDDRSLFRFAPGYGRLPIETAYDWSAWGGIGGAVEMCNNNGHCRKFDAGTMCPSYRATRDEQHLTRGRANTLRLALSGQLGPDGMRSDAVKDAMDLCVGCKGCRRECPTGVDMARMKLEWLHQKAKDRAPSLRERLVGRLPDYAPTLAKVPWLANLRNDLPGLAGLTERFTGLSAKRALPRWRSDAFRDAELPALTGTAAANTVVLFADTFDRYFEPQNLRAAAKVLGALGFDVRTARPPADERPLCCGRTHLATGDVARARSEAHRLLDALAPALAAGCPIVGLEPSCLFTLKDEYLALGLGPAAGKLAAQAVLLEDVVARSPEAAARAFGPLAKRVLLHGHCHQKAFGAMPAVTQALALVPELAVTEVVSSCCGMAGSFGYEAEHHAISLRMAEASLLPAVRQAGADTLIVADGTSCRHQIADGTGRSAMHLARVLEMALAGNPDRPSGATTLGRTT